MHNRIVHCPHNINYYLKQSHCQDGKTNPRKVCLLTYTGIPAASRFAYNNLLKEYLQLRVEQRDVLTTKNLKLE